VQNFAFKFQAAAEKTAKIVRGLLYFAAPCICGKIASEIGHSNKNSNRPNDGM